MSKLFQTHHVWEGDESRCHETLAQTLADLQLDYLDLFLIHWPFGFGVTPHSPSPLPALDLPGLRFICRERLRCVCGAGRRRSWRSRRERRSRSASLTVRTQPKPATAPSRGVAGGCNG